MPALLTDADINTAITKLVVNAGQYLLFITPLNCTISISGMFAKEDKKMQVNLGFSSNRSVLFPETVNDI